MERFSTLGECRDNKPCLDPRVSRLLSMNLAMGIVQSHRKIGHWGKQMDDSAVKGQKQQVLDLRSAIAEELKHVDSLQEIMLLVDKGTCNGHGPAPAKKAPKGSALETLPKGKRVVPAPAKSKGVSPATIKKVAAETAAHAAQKELEGILQRA
jgi:hypothetical protein